MSLQRVKANAQRIVSIYGEPNVYLAQCWRLETCYTREAHNPGNRAGGRERHTWTRTGGVSSAFRESVSGKAS